MKNWQTWALSILVFSIVVHIALIYSIPTLLMNKVLENTKEADGANNFVHRPIATAKNKSIIRPNPDIAYSSCTIDVSQGPVKITIPASQPYSSLSILAADTSNLLTINDQQATDGKIVLVVAKAGQKTPSDAKKLILSSDTALALARYAIKDKGSWEDLDTLRKSAKCMRLL